MSSVGISLPSISCLSLSSPTSRSSRASRRAQIFIFLPHRNGGFDYVQLGLHKALKRLARFLALGQAQLLQLNVLLGAGIQRRRTAFASFAALALVVISIAAELVDQYLGKRSGDNDNSNHQADLKHEQIIQPGLTNRKSYSGIIHNRDSFFAFVNLSLDFRNLAIHIRCQQFLIKPRRGVRVPQ